MPSAGLDVSGDLKIIQKQPLAHKGLDERFSAPIFNKTTIFPEAFNFKKIIRQYNEQNGKYLCGVENINYTRVVGRTKYSRSLNIVQKYPKNFFQNKSQVNSHYSNLFSLTKTNSVYFI